MQMKAIATEDWRSTGRVFPRLPHIGGALLAGMLLPLSLAPFDFWPAGVASVALYFALLNQGRVNPALLGYLYGVGAYGVGVNWVYVSIHEYGGALPPLSAGLVLLLVLWLACFPLLQAVIYAGVRRSAAQPGLVGAGVFVASWMLVEYLTFFTGGFPWLLPGYAHVDTALAPLIPVGGVWAASLGVLLAATFVVVALLPDRKPWVRLVALLIAGLPWILADALSGETWVAPVETRQVALVQGNIDQAVKWAPESRQPIIDRYLELTEPHWGRDLIVWPEAAITLYQHQAETLLSDLGARGQAEGSSLVLGIPKAVRDESGEVRLYNTALVVGNGGGQYLKQKLVPFGEYVPLADWLGGLAQSLNLPLPRAHAGPEWQQPLRLGEDAAGMVICFEVAYPGLTQRAVRNADVLLTITNDGWFGDSIGPLQHLQIARARALENGRWLLRAANDGVTAVIDHKGRVVQQLPRFEPGALTGTYQVMRGHTPFEGIPNPLVVMVLGLFPLLETLRANSKQKRSESPADAADPLDSRSG